MYTFFAKALVSIASLFGFLLIAGNSNAQNTFSAATKGSQKLYVCMDDLDPKTASYLQDRGVNRAQIIYQNFIDPNKDLRIDTAILGNRIRQLYPAVSQEGVGILDWEPEGFDKMDINSQEYRDLLNEFGKAVEYAKQIRPRVKWGFYGFPFREYWHFTDAWKKKCMSLIPLLKKCDLLAPSLYDFFPDSIRAKNNDAYIQNNITMALQIGDMINRPVYPFVWHRWHDSSKEYGLIAIPLPEFQSHIRKITNINYNGKKVAGIIWWGAEKFFYAHKPPVMLQEARAFSNFNAYQENTVKTYSNGLLQIFDRRKKDN